MQSFPSALYEACPTQQGSGIVLDRPWWRMCFEPPMAGWYVRTDMLLSLATDDLNQAIIFGPPWMIGMELHAGLAEFDKRHPAKHPRWRAGQVWGDKYGNTVVLSRFGRGTLYWIEPDSDGWLSFCQEHEECIGSGKKFNYPFLVADPACPHLAPWAPAEAA